MICTWYAKTSYSSTWFLSSEREDFFSYLQDPYLSDAGSKSKYSEFENLILQSQPRRKRMMELIMNGNAGIGGIFQMFGGAARGASTLNNMFQK